MRTIFPTFNEIKIGEPDANVEFYSALRTNDTPIFLDCFFANPSFPENDFSSGAKFLIFGQKGTGKTSIMRYLEHQQKETRKTHFLVFKRTFNEESDLEQFSKIPLMIDEEEIKKFKHFHHSIKRIIIFILIKQSLSLSPVGESEEIPDQERPWIEKISKTSFGELISLGFDSIRTIASTIGVNLENLTDGKALISLGKAIKRNNDDLLSYIVKRARRLNLSSSIFIDEIHFSYRSTEALQQDAMIVRDCILASHSLNDRFSEERVDLKIYISVRSEYLEHPIISSADINHSIESVGFNLTWSTYPHNNDHPLFNLLYQRFKLSIGDDFVFSDFMNVYFKGLEPAQFLSRTWVKPRDFIRFFKCAKELYPRNSRLSRSEQNAVWRQYAQNSWNETKSAASAFLNPPAIAKLEDIFRRSAPQIIDKIKKYDYIEFQDLLLPVYKISKGNNVNFYDLDHFMELIYILGIFGTIRHGGHGNDIIQTYHRGNRSFHRDGRVIIHPTILKAFG